MSGKEGSPPFFCFFKSQYPQEVSSRYSSFETIKAVLGSTEEEAIVDPTVKRAQSGEAVYRFYENAVSKYQKADLIQLTKDPFYVFNEVSKLTL